SFGDTIRPPSVRSAVFVMSLKPASTAVDGNTSLTQSGPKFLGEHFALIVEIPLGRDVVEIERIGVGLIREGSAMADNDDEAAGTERLRDVLVVCGGRRRCGHRHAQYGRQANGGRKRDCPSGEFEHLLFPQRSETFHHHRFARGGATLVATSRYQR